MSETQTKEPDLEIKDQVAPLDAPEAEAPDTPAPEPEDVIVTIGDEPAPEPPEEDANLLPWVRTVRKDNFKLQREIAELRAQLATKEAAPPPATDPGKKPTLEDHDYDTEAYEREITAWYERKRNADAEITRQLQAEQEQQKAWQAKLEGYGKAKAELRVPDYEEAEAVAQATFTVPQQSIIVAGAENPALLIYAMGRNEAKAKELAAITDPVKFTFAIAKLEAQLKVTPRKAPPAPEKQIRSTGGVPMSGAVDSTLERLRDEAARTGNATKVHAYRMAKRNAGKK
jgi:hypothetical protein